MKYLVTDVVSELNQLIDEQLDYLEKNIRPLDKEALHWRPGENRWNILEVVEHLNRFGDHYLPKLDQSVEYPKAKAKSDHYRTGFLGEFSFKQVRPAKGVIPNKAKSPSGANPFLRQLDTSVFDVHQKQQNSFKEIVEKSQFANWSKNGIPTLAFSWLKFNLGDTMRILAYHAERHYVQLDNLVKKRLD